MATAVAVNGAGVVDNGQLFAVGDPLDLLLMAIEERANLGHARTVKEGHRLEAANAPFKEEVHHQGLHRVIIVMSQRDFGDPPLCQRRVEAAAAQFCTQ